MQRKTLGQSALAGSVCALALFASDAWKTKDYTQWTSEDIQKVLTDSPWAKQITVTSGQSGGGGRRGGGRGGGMGGGRGGIGFPGGGGGYPGGGGGGYPGGGGGGYPGGATREEIVLRWESALPIQQALLRQGGHADESSKPSADADQKDKAKDKDKYYVVAVMGLRFPTRRNDSDSSDSDQDRSSQNNDDLRSRFLDAAQLIPKSKVAIAAEDVQFEGRNGSIAMRFLFPKTFPLSAEDKEIIFHFEARGVKFEHKFKLSDMLYQGQLSL